MTEKLNDLVTKFFLINKKKAFKGTDLMDYFDCHDQLEFTDKFIKPTCIEITKYGEVYENHILTIDNEGGIDFIFSELAAMLMGHIFAKMPNPLQNAGFELNCAMGDAKHYDSSFFVNPNSPHRELRVGNLVEIQTSRPDVLYPVTSMINYKGLKGRIVEKTEKGNFHVVVNSNLPAAEFIPSHLKLITK